MAYKDVVFPDIRLKHGITKSVLDPVTITGNGAREVRRRQNRHARYALSYPGRLLKEADRLAIFNFLQSVNISQDSFKVLDPTMPKISGKLMNRSGSTWYLTIPINQGTPGTHPIMNPDRIYTTFMRNMNVVSVTYNGVDETGMPYITIPGSSSTDYVTMTGPNYMTVRFDGTLSWSIAAMQPPAYGNSCTNITPTVVELSDFSLVEVFEV